MVARLRPSRPTVFAVAAGLVALGLRIRDSLDKASWLDTWLSTNRTTVLGQIVSELLASAWVILLFGLFLWWHDSNTRKLSVPAFGNADDLARELDARTQQRDAAQEQRRAAQIQADAYKSQRDEYKSGAEHWTKIAPISAAYSRTVRLSEGLSEYIAQLLANPPKQDTSGGLSQQSRNALIERLRSDKAGFDKRYRADLVKLLADLRSNFGLVGAKFPDEIFNGEIIGTTGLQDFVDGLNTLADELKNMLAKKASEE